MKLIRILENIDSQTTKTKVVADFKSKFLQISDWEGQTVWAGMSRDLTQEELDLEVIPTLLSRE